MDMISGKEEFPSFYLIDAVKQMTGKDAIGRENYKKALDGVSVPWMLNSQHQCLDCFEWAVHHLIKGTKGFPEHIMKTSKASLSHFKAHVAYWDSRVNEHTGFIDMDGRKGQSNNPRVSATELEAFMTCPYRWFIERRLGIRELEEPETLERPDAMTTGSILHDVLEKYMNQVKNGKHYPKKLNGILSKTIKEKVSSTGKIASIYVEKLKKDMGVLTGNFLKHEEKHVKGDRKPAFFEFAFGTEYKKNIEDAPVNLKIGAHKIRLSGSIDRIDIEGNEAFILDYKSSEPKNYKTVEFMQGQRLQPALYAEAFKKLRGKELKIKIINSGYLPLKKNSMEFLVPHVKDRKDKLKKIIDFIISSMKEGYFFTTGNCHWCKYCNICGKGITFASAYKMEQAPKDKRVKVLAKAYRSFEDF